MTEVEIPNPKMTPLFFHKFSHYKTCYWLPFFSDQYGMIKTDLSEQKLYPVILLYLAVNVCQHIKPNIF